MDPLRFAPRMTGHEKEEPPHGVWGGPIFCVRSTPLRRLGGGCRGTYIPVPGALQDPTTKHGLVKLSSYGKAFFLFSKKQPIHTQRLSCSRFYATKDTLLNSTCQ